MCCVCIGRRNSCRADSRQKSRFDPSDRFSIILRLCLCVKLLKMFRKPFKIKSNSQVKSSERKNIKDNLQKSFPSLTEADLETLLPKKEVINSIKLVTAANEIVQVYTIQKRPMVFDIRGTLFPTIYLLWKFPDLIVAFTTHPQVMSNICSGADLMLPGVLTPPHISGLAKYGKLKEGAPAYVNLSSNKAAVAVGVTAQSSADMLTSGGKGKCLTVYHYFGDKLCTFEDLPNLPLPDLGPPDWLKMKSYDEDFPVLGSTGNVVEKDVEEVSDAVENIDLDPTDSPDLEEDQTTPMTPEAMDQLLSHCFFTVIKYSKTLSLPILTSNFYKLQMIPVCPEGQSLDVKQSSFKKLKPFLDAMSKDGVIGIKEVKKGVEQIVSINKDHPKFTEFYVEPSIRPRKAEDDTSSAPTTSVTESYIITANVLPIFEGLNKGDTVQMIEIRRHITEFVKKHNCQDEENKRLIRPKNALVKICNTENKITWEELMEKVCGCMKSCYKVSSGADEVVNKGKVSPITMTISQRSGNKKVTLVDNLDLFGIRLSEFAKECQHGVAASTSISRPPGKKSDQLLVQGNQVLFIYNLLTEKYKIPVKYIRGLENAPKKKK